MSWAVLVCQPQHERKLGDAIADSGREAFVPTYTAWRPRFGKHGAVTRPLVPGYAFAIMEPHEVHDFHAHGAVRLLPMNWRLSLRLAQLIQEWRDDEAAGKFDEARPAEQRIAKITNRRNRKTRRLEGQAKRCAVGYEEGLRAILHEMHEPQQVAA